jgi:hypothetical protein
MPRTPAPLTVMDGAEHDHPGWWAAIDPHGMLIVAIFKSEADARAFVALPALIEAATSLRNSVIGMIGIGISDSIGHTNTKVLGDHCQAVFAALAQADGPAPTEE